MKDKFVSQQGFEIPLHEVSFAYTEENPRFKDSFWTSYTLPIDFYYTREFLSQFGHYASLQATGLKRYHEGEHIFEGSPRKAKMEILEMQKNLVKIQINSGFENLPNFDKKLSDLPLLNLEVADIYSHANEIVSKKYPETAYNFPKLYTDEYDTSTDAWKYFDSFINNRTQYQGDSAKIFQRNRLQDGTDVYNKNIMHPMPYLLYLLKEGFRDAGFLLEGEILEDPHLKQRLVYSGKPYYYTGEQKEHKVVVYHKDFDNTHLPAGQGKWEGKVKIHAPGKYNIRFYKYINIPYQHGATIKIRGENTEALATPIHITMLNSQLATYPGIDIDISEEEAEKGATLFFEYWGLHPLDQYGTHAPDIGKNLGAFRIHINPHRIHTQEGEPILYVFNQNRVQLKKAVPDMTFGELVTTIKNWRNYDLIFEGNRAIMNTIQLGQEDVVDFRAFEVEDPQRAFNDKVSFNIKFPEHEAVEIQQIFIDENGAHFDKKTIPDTATEININGFGLPLVMFRGAYTAKAYNDAALMLVYYDGLNAEGDNHAQNPKGLMGELLVEYLKPWYMNRLTNYSYKWTFITEKNKLRNINIRSEIFCYGRRHLIKSWTKRSISERLYMVEMETETY